MYGIYVPVSQEEGMFLTLVERNNSPSVKYAALVHPQEFLDENTALGATLYLVTRLGHGHDGEDREKLHALHLLLCNDPTSHFTNGLWFNIIVTNMIMYGMLELAWRGTVFGRETFLSKLGDKVANKYFLSEEDEWAFTRETPNFMRRLEAAAREAEHPFGHTKFFYDSSKWCRTPRPLCDFRSCPCTIL